jgi:hypothetical protein
MCGINGIFGCGTSIHSPRHSMKPDFQVFGRARYGDCAYAAFTVVEDPDRFEFACAMEGLKPERDQGARHR